MEATKLYLGENVNWKTYYKIMLDPIVFFSGPSDKDKGLSQEDKQHILDYFFNKLYKSIEESPFLEHATQPGPGTIPVQNVVVSLDESHVTLGGHIDLYLTDRPYYEDRYDKKGQTGLCGRNGD